MSGSKSATDLDHVIGQRIRLARVTAGLSQGELADLVGVTFQQIQKYECATNRVSASRLHVIAGHLHKPIASFFLPLDEAS